MKKLIFTLLTIVAVQAGLQAQHCSGQTATCAPAGLAKPGLSPLSDCLEAVINGVAPTTVIHFKNYDTARYMGSLVTVVRLRVDSINNLPSGLCWVMDHANNIYANQEDGCINIFGTPNGAVGQYKLKIKVGVDIDLPTNPFIPVDAADVGLNYYVRLVNSGDGLMPCLDTAGAPTFKAYSGTQTQCACVSGINETHIAASSLNIVPNPMNNNAVVSFVMDKAGVMTEKMTNIIGSEIFKNEKEVRAGENKFQISRNNLPPGIYFYSLSDGISSVTQRLIISE